MAHIFISQIKPPNHKLHLLGSEQNLLKYPFSHRHLQISKVIREIAEALISNLWAFFSNEKLETEGGGGDYFTKGCLHLFPTHEYAQSLPKQVNPT